MMAAATYLTAPRCPRGYREQPVGVPSRTPNQHVRKTPKHVPLASHTTVARSNRASSHGEAKVSRRLLLSSAPLSLFFSAGLSWTALPALAIETQTTLFNNSGISFEYPKGWLKAYDRTEKAPVGGLILIGDFKTVDTVSLVSSEIPDELQNLSNGSIDSQVVAQEVLKEPLSSTSTMSLDIRSAETVEGHAPGPTYRIEYVLEVCRGSREEGVGGHLSCVGPKGNELQTVQRHHVDLITEKNGLLYKFSVSAEEARWQQVSVDLLNALSTFVIA